MDAYRIKLELPADTTEENAVKETIKLEHGAIRLIEIAFPDGCADLAHARVMDGIINVSPRNEGEWWAWNDFTIRYDPNYKMRGAPFELQVEGWNEDIYYAKYIIFRFYVDPKGDKLGENLLQTLFNYVPFGRD